MSEVVSGLDTAASLSEQQFNRLLLVVLAAGMVVLTVLIVTAGALLREAHVYSGWVNHTYEAEYLIASFQMDVERAEVARRGYLLVPDDSYRKIYLTERSTLDETLNHIGLETIDNPIQRRGVLEMRRLMTVKLALSDESMALVQHGQTAEALKRFSAQRALKITGRVRALSGRMIDEEKRLLAIRADRETRSNELIFAVVLGAVILLAVLSLVALVVVRRYADGLSRSRVALKLLNEELEDRVQARTADLSRVNEEVQRFAYIVSHDLRSPLVNVMGFTSELEESLKPLHGLVDWIKTNSPGRLPKTVTDAVEVDLPESIGFIRAATRKMDRLINAILSLSREGRRTLASEPLKMNELMGGLIDAVRHQLDQSQSMAMVEGALPDLTSDRLVVEQVFSNLLDNAVKYLKPGRPGRIIIRARSEAYRVIYEVEDNGRGIAERDFERVFELFRRAGTQDQPGEGIGLAHVRALVTRLGGAIDCVSTLDQGTTFRVSLPRAMTIPQRLAA